MTENTAVQTYDLEQEGLAPAPVPAETETGSAALMRLIERAATSDDFDVGKLEKLLDVKEKWDATEARKEFVAALNAFKANPPEIVRNKEIDHNGKHIANYADLNQVSVAIGKALADHQISHRWDVQQLDGGAIRVTCILTHVAGHSERTTLQAGADNSGSKNSVQAIGSTVSYLERYTLLAATGMSTADMDDDGSGADPTELISEDQKAEIIELIKETGADSAAFLKYLGYVSVDAIPASMFGRAINALNKKREQQA